MDSKDHYIKEFLISKPPTMGKLTSHGYKRLKTRRWNKENGRNAIGRAPIVDFCLQKHALDHLSNGIVHTLIRHFKTLHYHVFRKVTMH